MLRDSVIVAYSETLINMCFLTAFRIAVAHVTIKALIVPPLPEDPILIPVLWCKCSDIERNAHAQFVA